MSLRNVGIHSTPIIRCHVPEESHMNMKGRGQCDGSHCIRLVQRRETSNSRVGSRAGVITRFFLITSLRHPTGRHVRVSVCFKIRHRITCKAPLCQFYKKKKFEEIWMSSHLARQTYTTSINNLFTLIWYIKAEYTIFSPTYSF